VSRVALAALLVCVLLVPPASAGAAGSDGGAIVAVYPNPVEHGDRGEFVVVSVPEAGNWTLSDGETTVALPSNVSGTIVVGHPEAGNPTDHRLVEGALRLANGGERLVLRRNGAVVSRLHYGDAPEGEVHRDGEWRPLGATDRDVVVTDGGTARAFVLPDAPALPVETLRAADRRVLLAGYTFTDEQVADALRAAHERNVTVRVLVEGSPVGGLTRRQARVLDSLARSGVEVRAVGGPWARYDHHHAKYAVVDDRALVLTENWKPAGTGGRSSRGWGVRLDDPKAAAALAATFRADAGWRDAVPWEQFRRGRSFRRDQPANGSYPAAVAPETVPVAETRVLVAPDNAERALVGTLDGADESIRVVQMSVGGRQQPFVRALVRAARRGVEVRLLLSGAWYTREENRALVAAVNDLADRRDLPLEARLARPRGQFEKVHAKGVVVDGERAVVGSLNWNNHSARKNREVAVVLEGEAVAGYYAVVFDEDWRRSGERGLARRLPVGLLVAVVVGALVALAVAARIRTGVR